MARNDVDDITSKRNDRRFDGPDPRSILIVLPTWVGDFVMATPFLRAVRKRFAHSRITFLMEPNLRDLVRGGDWMDECVERPPRRGLPPIVHRVNGRAERRSSEAASRHFTWDLRRRRYDWAVLLPNSFRAALLAWLIRAKRRIGYDRDGRGLLLTDRLPVRNRRSRRSASATSVTPPYGANLPVPAGRFLPLPLVEYYAELAEFIGCARPGDRLELHTTEDCDDGVARRLTALGPAERRPLVVVSPGARYGAAKCWMPERFAAVADRLIDAHGASVVVTCGPGEEAIARQIGEAMSQPARVLDDPGLSLGELKSLIRRSDLLICNDAGPRHIAKAFDVPVVAIFGPTHPQWTATGYPDERIVRIDVDCGPCQQRVCPLSHLKCMDGVPTEMVYEASRDLLTRRLATRFHNVRHEEVGASDSVTRLDRP